MRVTGTPGGSDERDGAGAPRRGTRRAAAAVAAGVAAALAAGARPAPAVVAQTVGEAGAITEYPLAEGSRPFGITVGPDGALWFTQLGGWCAQGAGNKIGRLTVAGALTEYSVPRENSYPGAIAAGPDGALWFGAQAANAIGRLSPDGRFAAYPVPTAVPTTLQGCTHPTSRPGEGGLVVGPDGALWFGESSGNKVGRLGADGGLTEFPIPTPYSAPIGITAGPDGALWFVERQAGKVGRITTAGALTEYPLPEPAGVPNQIVAGPDGALWFTALQPDRVGRLTTAGVLTEYALPGLGPVGITVGPDRALWLTAITSNEIARLTPEGQVTHRYAIPTPASTALRIVTGPDGALWFTQQAGDKVGRLQLRPAPAALPRTGGAPPPAWLAALGGLILAGAGAAGRARAGGRPPSAPAAAVPASSPGHRGCGGILGAPRPCAGMGGGPPGRPGARENRGV
jgi:virginiamycin B lyase